MSFHMYYHSCWIINQPLSYPIKPIQPYFNKTFFFLIVGPSPLLTTKSHLLYFYLLKDALKPFQLLSDLNLPPTFSSGFLMSLKSLPPSKIHLSPPKPFLLQQLFPLIGSHFLFIASMHKNIPKFTFRTWCLKFHLYAE